MKNYLLKPRNSFALIIAFLMLSAYQVRAQNYDHILNYSIRSAPVYGVKIKTNLPFENGMGMPTITITGYNFGSYDPISLTLVYYVWWAPPYNSSTYYFYEYKISSSGAYTPKVYLSNESGKVVIYIDDKSNFQRFTVSAFGQGEGENSSWFTGWTAVDEALTGTNTVEVPYRNRFKGEVYMPGNGLWNSNGNVLIGKTTQINSNYKLDVDGKIRGNEIVVNTTGADFVFEPDYKLRPLSELEQFVNKHKHLPEISPAKDMQLDGMGVGEMQTKLLQKIEELTLYLIKQDKELKNERLIRNVYEERLKKLEARN